MTNAITTLDEMIIKLSKGRWRCFYRNKNTLKVLSKIEIIDLFDDTTDLTILIPIRFKEKTDVVYICERIR